LQQCYFYASCDEGLLAKKGDHGYLLSKGCGVDAKGVALGETHKELETV
jgi:hypothetical protein